jgi:hypothetical protein
MKCRVSSLLRGVNVTVEVAGELEVRLCRDSTLLFLAPRMARLLTEWHLQDEGAGQANGR